jgi:outer membrane protein assembly factor BamB
VALPTGERTRRSWVVIGAIVGTLTLGAGAVAGLGVRALIESIPSFDFDLDLSVGPTAQTTFEPSAMPGRALLWSTATGAGVTSAPKVEGGSVYVRDADGGVRAFNALSGAPQWTAPAGRGTVSGVDFAPAVAGGVVYVAGWDGVLHAFDAATGRARWDAPLGTSSFPFASGGFPLTVVDGIVYVNAKGLAAFDAATGEPRWRVSTGKGDPSLQMTSYSMPVVAEGLVYVGGDDGAVQAVDTTTGVTRWSSEQFPALDRSSDAEPSIYGIGPTSVLTVAGGLVYAAGQDGKLHALDARTGAERWVADIGTPNAFGSAPVVTDGTVYVASDALRAFDAATGARRWVARTGGASLFSFVPPVVRGDVVYVPGGDSLLHEFDAGTGAPRRTGGRVPPAPVRSPLFGRPVVAIPPAFAGDLLFLASGDRRLYVYRDPVLPG